MSQLTKSILSTPRPISRKEGDKTNSRSSRDGRKALWFSSLVIALLVAFLVLSFDFFTSRPYQWRIGQIAPWDVYSPVALCVSSPGDSVSYLQGQIIIRRGEKVIPTKFAALSAISKRAEVKPLPRTVGYLLLLLVLGHIINKFFKAMEIKWLEQKRSLNLFLVTIVLTILSMKLIAFFGGDFQTFILLNPVPVATILLSLLLGYEAAVISAIVLSPIFGVIVAGGGQSMAVAYALLGAFGGALMVGPESSVRRDIFKATLLLSAVNGALIISFVLFNYLPGSQVVYGECWGPCVQWDSQWYSRVFLLSPA